MELTVAVDRIEGDIAVLDVGGVSVDWPLASLPAGTTEGSTLSVVFNLTPPDLAEAKARLERLAARGPKSDIIDL